MIEVYDYSDFRKFLGDYYELNKVLNSGFSYRYLAQKANINSAPFYKHIIEGKRNLTRSTIIKTAIALKLNDREAEYFEYLVFFNQARTIEEKNSHFDKLMALQKAKKVYKVKEDNYEYYSKWYHCVIRELVVMDDFNGNFSKVVGKIKSRITPKQARDSVNLLLKLGFLKKENGKYIQTEPVISAGQNIKSYKVIQFQINMLRRAIDIYDKKNTGDRLMSSTTYALSENSYELLKKKIRNFKIQLQEIVRLEENPSKVYQMNVNFFPLAD